MTVLVFLATRVLINSFRRAFENPLRAVLTTVVIAFVLLGWGGALIGSILGSGRNSPPPMAMDPATLVVRSVSLTVLIHWFYVFSLGSSALFRPMSLLFQESDVHYLFTTPLRPLSVFRGLLLLRGLFGALALMLMLVIYLLFFGGRSLTRLVANMEPVASSWLLLSYPLLYLLVFVGILFVSVVVVLKEIQGHPVRRSFTMGFIGWGVLSLGVVGWRFYEVYGAEANLLIALGHAFNWGPSQVLLFPVRGLADASLVLYQGWTPAMTASWLFLGGVAWWGHRQLVRHQGWLYELGAELARLGGKISRNRRDPMRAYMERAMERAEKKPLRSLHWLERWTPSGVFALLWRDLLIAWRASGWANLLLIAVMALIPVGTMALVAFRASSPSTPATIQTLYMFVQGMVAFFYAFGSYYGMTEMLRRVEWQKPMPFTAWQVVVVESLPTVLFFVLGQVLTVGGAIALFPDLWLYWVVGGLTVTAWLIVLQMVMLMVALVNPDPSDYTQRLITSFLMVPLLCFGGGPGVLVWVFGTWLKWHVLLMGIVALVVQGLVAMVLVAINGTLYERFNPID